MSHAMTRLSFCLPSLQDDAAAGHHHHHHHRSGGHRRQGTLVAETVRRSPLTDGPAQAHAPLAGPAPSPGRTGGTLLVTPHPVAHSRLPLA